MRKQRGGRAKLHPRIRLAVRIDQAHVGGCERAQHRVDTVGHRDIRRLFGLQPPQVPADDGQPPQRDFEPRENLAAAGMAWRLDVAICHPAKAEAVGDIVDGTQEPREAVDQRAVEIEDDEGVGRGERMAAEDICKG